VDEHGCPQTKYRRNPHKLLFSKWKVLLPTTPGTKKCITKEQLNKAHRPIKNSLGKHPICFGDTPGLGGCKFQPIPVKSTKSFKQKVEKLLLQKGLLPSIEKDTAKIE